MTVDTNIIIGYLGGDEAIVQLLNEWRRMGRSLFLSSVVETEVLSFSSWTIQEQYVTQAFLEQNFVSVVFDRRVARIAARIRRENKIKFPDAAIAATAFHTRSPLLTRNVRDFKRIPQLRVLTI